MASQTMWIGVVLLVMILSRALKPAGVLGIEVGSVKLRHPSSRVALDTSTPTTWTCWAIMVRLLLVDTNSSGDFGLQKVQATVQVQTKNIGGFSYGTHYSCVPGRINLTAASKRRPAGLLLDLVANGVSAVDLQTLPHF